MLVLLMSVVVLMVNAHLGVGVANVIYFIDVVGTPGGGCSKGNDTTPDRYW